MVLKIKMKSGRGKWYLRLFDYLAGMGSGRVLLILGSMIVLLTTIIYAIEKTGGRNFDNFGKAIYWMVVTLSTTGYGDITPETSAGRALTVVLIILSLVFVSSLTATIASRLVENRLMEGKGMTEVKLKGHLIICGWNSGGKSLLETIYRESSRVPGIVLVNELPEEEIGELLYRYREQDLKFVRGDSSQENVLERAGVRFAEQIIILANGRIEEGFSRADERALLTALSARSLNPNIRIAAELVNAENRRHLERAGVDPIIAFGSGHDLLFANFVIAPGICLAGQELLSAFPRSHFKQAKIPSHLEGASFGKIREHFRQSESALVFGLAWEQERGIGLDDVLSGDLTAIDQFLKKQFEGIEQEFFKKGKTVEVKINPADDFIVKKGSVALLIV